MPAEEKQALIDQLKGRWEELNADFQKLPLQLDTSSKLRRKNLLEAQLARVEADIQLLQQRKEVIIVQG